MKILIVGNGARESALGVKLQEDKRISKIFFAKGNATTDNIGQNYFESDIVSLRNLAIQENIDLTIVGPEAPLVDGIVDDFRKHDLKIFGATARCAKLEGSKAYSKKFMQTYNIKTAKAQVFEAYHDAIAYVKNHDYPLVIKASGLAGGKGVVVCEDVLEANATIHKFMIDRIYGDAGIQLVIEDFLEGYEVSIIAFSNGQKLFPCIPAKDYKKAGKGETGANTGGMGSAAPSPEWTAENQIDFEKNILEPTIFGLQEKNLNFRGFIFFGLMVTKNGCYLLEYNMRLGDPETQVLMALLENNLVDTIESCLNGDDVELKFSDKKAVCLVICSGGYPQNYETGFEIKGTDKVEHSTLLFAGASREAKRIVTSGGRVLSLVATGDSFDEARDKVYADALPIHFDYAYYRDDIGKF
ncbi:phosphoribosylamine--glycine ligase [Halpernia frigidisoli]|uniref:Phosphoribosylamine--glycine ligase n=1 Tax=Halpernia frigidisoli TaxID=1125876 RepID=A0A1I3DRW1_9FLAO|nr:phosphoribosylamine--glycine ligase [Halpernia frigidisoli]SFH89475.1 phosphoribosylamine--glycine ligase [Halpernia frigidisoli]